MHKPIVEERFSVRVQVDLTEMQSIPNGQFKWIQVAQNPNTKRILLKPLRYKSGLEVSEALIRISAEIESI